MGEAVVPAKLDRVVVGVDFSAPSIAAIDWTRKHLAPNVPCSIVHALDVPRPPEFLRDAFPSRDEIVDSARVGAIARLEQLRDEHGWGAVDIDVRDGRAEHVMAAAAADAGANLIIVGEHARPRAMWSSLGSTAEALVRCSPVPVLLARGELAGPPKRILVGIDESAHAMAALQWARLLSQRTGAALTAVHVFRPVYLGVAEAVSGMHAARTLEEKQRQQTEEWYRRQLDAAGCPPETTALELASGEPASALVAAQRGGNFDLVVVGSTGAGGIGRMLLGSVATAVLRGASCPVLVVHG